MDKYSRNRFTTHLFNFLTVSGDLIILNLLWLICSLPIITIGPATCALYKVSLKIIEDRTYPVLKNYFRAFKENFKQSIVVGLFFILELFIVYSDLIYISNVEGMEKKVFIVVMIITIAIVLIAITYLNALIARYNNSLKNHIINAFKLAFVNPFHTILMWIVLLLPIAAFLFLEPVILLTIAWFFIMFLVSLPVYICSYIMTKVFRKFDLGEGEDNE